jgi:hypothetical protein
MKGSRKCGQRTNNSSLNGTSWKIKQFTASDTRKIIFRYGILSGPSFADIIRKPSRTARLLSIWLTINRKEWVKLKT